MTSFTDATDTVEIVGSCKDVNRKNNRIIVKVYAGENTSATPYIDNDIADECQATGSGNVLKSGFEPDEFKITQNILMSVGGGNYVYPNTLGAVFTLISGPGGITAGGVYTPTVAGVAKIQAVYGSYYAFSTITIQAGSAAPIVKIDTNKCFFVTSGIGLTEYDGSVQKIYPQCFNGRFGFSFKIGKAQKYKARIKLRTIDGTLSDTAWNDVTISRVLSTPVLTTVSQDTSNVRMIIESTPARFNFGTIYTLARTYTDIYATSAGLVQLYLNQTTSEIFEGFSVFKYFDNGLVEGVSYNYTLQSTDTNWSTTSPVSLTSAVVTKEMPLIKLNTTGAVGTTCFFNISPSTSNTYEWAFAVGNPAWIGTTRAGIPTGTSCVTSGGNPICNASGLAAATDYYFAVRASNNGQVGKWSDTVRCRTQ